MTSTRKGAAQKEAMGHLMGGYETLARALAASIRAKGGEVHASRPIAAIEERHGRVAGLRLQDGTVECDAVVATMADPVLARGLPASRLSGQFRSLVTSLVRLRRTSRTREQRRDQGQYEANDDEE